MSNLEWYPFMFSVACVIHNAHLCPPTTSYKLTQFKNAMSGTTFPRGLDSPGTHPDRNPSSGDLALKKFFVYSGSDDPRYERTIFAGIACGSIFSTDTLTVKMSEGGVIFNEFLEEIFAEPVGREATSDLSDPAQTEKFFVTREEKTFGWVTFRLPKDYDLSPENLNSGLIGPGDKH